MDTEPYVGMKYNEVPIVAIKEGIDWIKQNGAKMCGQSLLPLPLSSMMDKHPQLKGHVYVLKADVNYTLNDTSPGQTGSL